MFSRHFHGFEVPKHTLGYATGQPTKPSLAPLDLSKCCLAPCAENCSCELRGKRAFQESIFYLDSPFVNK